MLKKTITTFVGAAVITAATSASLFADNGAAPAAGVAVDQAVAPAIVTANPTPTLPDDDTLDRLVDLLGPSVPRPDIGNFASRPGGIDGKTYCCDQQDNCYEVDLLTLCPADWIKTHCDDEGNCEDEE